MMRSLYSGVTGLRSHQTKMDVIGNNIANVNTIGYKSSRVVFEDIFSQTIASATTPTANSGGTNPQQIGLGVQLSTIDVSFTTAAAPYTGNPLDLAIDGDGFFVIREGTDGRTFTRAGNFKLDSKNFLVDSNGNYVLGCGANETLAEDGSNLKPIEIDPKYTDISINRNGQVVGIDSTTNTTTVIAQIAIATFSNPNGLEKTGGNSYRETGNSGNPVFRTPGTGSAGSINPSSLEMSNVDLTSEFTDMIVTQRGFQANSRIITTTDEMLEELVNMVR